MRILQVVHQFLPEHVGGVELATQRLAHSLQSAGHEVAIFHRQSGPDGGWTAAAVEDLPVFSVWQGEMTPTARFQATFAGGRHELAQAYTAVLKSFRPDIVHVQHLMGLPPAITQITTEAGVPYLVSLHDYYYFCANAQLITNYDQTLCAGPRGWINCSRCALARAGKPGALWALPGLVPLLAWRQQRLAGPLAGAQATIVPTRFVAEAYAQAGIRPPNLRVIPYGIDPPDAAGRKLLAARRPFDRPPLRIAYVGGIAWQKGVHVLVEAVNRLPAGDVTLTVYGNLLAHPDYSAELRALASHPAIELAGPLARADLWQALARADVLVVPSLWHETSAMVIDEGFAAGLPVLASDLGGMREKIDPGRNGCLLPPGDSAALAEQLAELIDRPHLVRQMQAAEKSYFTTDQHQAAVAVLYAEVVGA